jgi:hypothetical protein
MTAYAAGAHSQCTESTCHLSGFLFVQLARAFAEQHSVLVVHTFLLFAILGPLMGPSSSKGINLAALQQGIETAGVLLNEIRVPVSIAAAVAVTGASCGCGGHNCSANVGVAHGCAYLVNFIDRQLTSAFPRKHSVVILSRHCFSPFLFVYIRPPEGQRSRAERIFV